MFLKIGKDKNNFTTLLLIAAVLFSIFIVIYATYRTSRQGSNIRRSGAAGVSCDVNNDGSINQDDLGTFYNYYFTNNMLADLNNDGVLNPLDQEVIESCVR